ASAETYSVVYKANGGTGGDVTDSSATKIASCTFTPPENKEFKCWNTKNDESGTTYNVGDSVTSNLELYAIWKDQGGGGGTGGEMVTSSNFTSGSTVYVSTGLKEDFYCVSSISTGTSAWLNTTKNDLNEAIRFTMSGTASAFDLSFTDEDGKIQHVNMTGNKAITLAEGATLYKVFGLNSDNKFCLGTTKLCTNSNSNYGIRGGYTEGANFLATYLYYDEAAPTTGYTIKFDANGGSGSQTQLQNDTASSFILPTSTTFTAPDDTKMFDGWSETKDGAKITQNPYTPTIEEGGSKTLYARWSDKTYSNIPEGSYTVTLDYT
ncbi:MAG: InlB B-repeat-containing protein, partial [Bacillota bacterium]|nr:InlB B-repeat-containing protein [Bacillota bacterium]